MKRVLVTGASGFVGRALCKELQRRGYTVRVALRSEQSGERHGLQGVEHAIVGEIHGSTDWRAALYEVDAIVHLAARVHIMRDEADDPLKAYRAVNTEGTLNLARQAASVGVRRLVYLSSIKVNGEGRGAPYTEEDAPMPMDPYAVSKWEAEQGLLTIAAQSKMEVVNLRPPLLYGPGVGGNFVRLLRVVQRRMPLPLGAICNHRDLLFLGNLLDGLALCLVHPQAAGQTYLIRDGEPMTTPELVRRLARLMGIKPFLLPIPQVLLLGLGKLIGKSAEMARLTGSLLIDDGKIRAQLGWAPPFSVDAGLQETVDWFRNLSPSE